MKYIDSIFSIHKNMIRQFQHMLYIKVVCHGIMTMSPNCSLSRSNFSLRPALRKASSDKSSISFPRYRSQLLDCNLCCSSSTSLL